MIAVHAARRSRCSSCSCCCSAAPGSWPAGPPDRRSKSSQPKTLLGQAGTLDVAVTAPGGALTDLDVDLEQGEQPVRRSSAGRATDQAELTQEERRPGPASRGRSASGSSRSSQRTGAASSSTATRPVLFGTAIGRDRGDGATSTVRLEPPRVAVLSLHHFINHGGIGDGRLSRDARRRRVRRARRRPDYPGFPAAGAGVAGADPALQVAFFALLLRSGPQHADQGLRARRGRQRSRARTSTTASSPSRSAEPHHDRRRVPRARRARDPRALAGLQGRRPEQTSSRRSWRINRDLRRENNADDRRAGGEDVAEACCGTARSSSSSNTQVESAFADQRTYFHDGKENRPAGAPRLRPGVAGSRRRSRRQPRRRRLRRLTSASTATA